MISFTCWCLLLLAMTKSQYEVRPAKEWRTLTDGVWLRRPLSVSYFLSASQTAGHFCNQSFSHVVRRWWQLTTDQCWQTFWSINELKHRQNSYFHSRQCVWNRTRKNRGYSCVCLKKRCVFLPLLPLYHAIMPSLFLWSLLYLSSIFLSPLTPSLCYLLEVLVITMSPGSHYFLWKQLIFTGLDNTFVGRTLLFFHFLLVQLSKLKIASAALVYCAFFGVSL